MKLHYPTKYKDSRGIENSTFISDGESLTIELRGITFEGNFYELNAVNDLENKAAGLFELSEFTYCDGKTGEELAGNIGYSLDNFSIEVEIPVKVLTNAGIEEMATIYFGTREFSKFNIVIDGKPREFKYFNFEFGLAEKHTNHLNINHIKCCINCQFGEYLPSGNLDYGDMRCFRKCKDAWSEIGYTGLKDPENWKFVKEMVITQEAYWCEEFELKH